MSMSHLAILFLLYSSKVNVQLQHYSCTIKTKKTLRNQIINLVIKNYFFLNKNWKKFYFIKNFLFEQKSMKNEKYF